jgi:cytochrome P450
MTAAQPFSSIDAPIGCGYVGEAVGDVAVPFAVEQLLIFLGWPLDPGRAKLIELVKSEAGHSFAVAADRLEVHQYLTEGVRQMDTPDSPLAPLGLTRGELMQLCGLLVRAAIDSVIAAFTYALLELARNPQLQDLLRADPAQIPAFIEEVLRLEPPVSGALRMTTEPVSIAGVELPARTLVVPHFGAVNRERGADGVHQTYPIARGGDDIQVEDGQVVRHRHSSFGHGPT